MENFGALLAHNRNYRYTWLGQIVSEVGDHFNNVAVLSLAAARLRCCSLFSVSWFSSAARKA